MSKEFFEAKLVYKASVDGEYGEDFYKKVDGLGSIVSLGKLTNGTTIAAFNSIPLVSEYGKIFIEDQTTMLLNLTDSRKFPITGDIDYAGFWTDPSGP